MTRRTCALFVLVILLAAPSSLAAGVSIVDANRTISVTGRAEIEFDPDQVVLSSAVMEEDLSAKAAQTRAMQAAARALAVAREFGIEDEDLEDLKTVRDAVDYVSDRAAG